MKQLFSTLTDSLRWLGQATALIIFSSWLMGCSGGISGTGDGGQIVVVDPGEGDLGHEGTSTDATAPINSLSPPIFNHQIFPERLIGQFSNSLNNAADLQGLLPTLATTPITQKIGIMWSIVNQQTTQAQLDIANIEESLLDVIQQCDSTDPCNSVPAVFTANLSTATLSFQQSLRPENTAAIGDQRSYSNVSYAANTAGYFDQKIQYTNQSGTTTRILWTDDNQLVSVFSENREAVIHTLTDFRNLTTTLRAEDKLTATIFSAVLVNTNTGETTLEADWHGNEQHYLRASATDTIILLYSIHPTDLTVSTSREAFDLSSGDYTIESCTTACTNWETLASGGNSLSTQLNTSEPLLADFSVTVSSDLQVSVPTETNEFIITSGAVIDQPVSESIVCSGQRVLSILRNYCWQPLPLTNPPVIYDELLNNGSLLYRLLPGAQVQ